MAAKFITVKLLRLSVHWVIWGLHLLLLFTTVDCVCLGAEPPSEQWSGISHTHIPVTFPVSETRKFCFFYFLSVLTIWHCLRIDNPRKYMRGEGKYLAKLYGLYPSFCWTKNFQCEFGKVFFLFHQEHPLMSCLTWTIFHPCHPVISVVIQWARYFMKLWNTCAFMAFFVLHFFMGLTFFLGPPWIYYPMKLRDHPGICLFDITTFQHINECVHSVIYSPSQYISCFYVWYYHFSAYHWVCPFSDMQSISGYFLFLSYVQILEKENSAEDMKDAILANTSGISEVNYLYLLQDFHCIS